MFVWKTLGNAIAIPGQCEIGASMLEPRKKAPVRERATAAPNERDKKREIMQAAQRLGKWDALFLATWTAATLRVCSART
jgi:hypothetical protein